MKPVKHVYSWKLDHARGNGPGGLKSKRSIARWLGNKGDRTEERDGERNFRRLEGKREECYIGEVALEECELSGGEVVL